MAHFFFVFSAYWNKCEPQKESHFYRSQTIFYFRFIWMGNKFYLFLKEMLLIVFFFCKRNESAKWILLLYWEKGLLVTHTHLYKYMSGCAVLFLIVGSHKFRKNTDAHEWNSFNMQNNCLLNIWEHDWINLQRKYMKELTFEISNSVHLTLDCTCFPCCHWFFFPLAKLN